MAVALVLLDLLQTSGRAEHWVLAYAWNPLLAIEVVGSGHIDIVGALFLVTSVAALAQMACDLSTNVWAGCRRKVSANCVGAALLETRSPSGCCARRSCGRTLYVPFLNRGRIPIGSLGTYCRRSALMVHFLQNTRWRSSSSVVGRTGGAGRVCDLNLAEKSETSMVSCCVCLANGSFTSLRT